MHWKPRQVSPHDLSVDKRGSLASLAKKYGVSAEEIVDKNGINWSSKAINAWVLEIGGKKLSSGAVVMVPGVVVNLPDTPLKEYEDPAAQMAPQASAVQTSGPTPWWVWGGLGLGGFALWRWLKKEEG